MLEVEKCISSRRVQIVLGRLGLLVSYCDVLENAPRWLQNVFKQES